MSGPLLIIAITRNLQLKKISCLKICHNSRHPQEQSDVRIQASRHKAFYKNTKRKTYKKILKIRVVFTALYHHKILKLLILRSPGSLRHFVPEDDESSKISFKKNIDTSNKF